MSTHFGTRWISKTKKNHRCGWCDKLIEAGSAASYAAGVFEGDFWNGHYHPECQAAQDAMMKDSDARSQISEGWSPGDYARGRTDDEFSKPPEFSTEYRGGDVEAARIAINQPTPEQVEEY